MTYGPGNIFGELEMFSSQPYRATETISTNASTIVACFSFEDMEAVSHELPELGLKLLRMCVSKGRNTLLRRVLSKRPSDLALLEPSPWPEKWTKAGAEAAAKRQAAASTAAGAAAPARVGPASNPWASAVDVVRRMARKEGSALKNWSAEEVKELAGYFGFTEVKGGKGPFLPRGAQKWCLVLVLSGTVEVKPSPNPNPSPSPGDDRRVTNRPDID